MANQNNLHAKQKPSKHPHPPHFSNGASLRHKHHVHMANPKNLRAKQKPSQHPQHPHPLTFLMVHPLVIVEIIQQMAWTKQIKRRHSPLQKLYGEWVQAFGETVCGIVWVDKDCLRLVMVLKATINQSWLTLIHPNDPTNRFAKGLYPFPLQFLG